MKLVVLQGRVSSRQQEACQVVLGDMAGRHGWELLKHSYDAAGSRPGQEALSASRTQQLYEAVHQHHTSVVSLLSGEATVRGGKRIPLGRFLRYKAVYRVATDGTELERAVEDIAAAAADDKIVCTNANDPRVLPLHLFAPKADFQALDGAAGRQTFQTQYRHQGSYRDEQRRPWVVPHPDEMHGRDRLTVGRFLLQDGFHWDVQSPFMPTKIRTPVRDYKVIKYGHANVHPDGRVTGQPGTAR